MGKTHRKEISGIFRVVSEKGKKIVKSKTRKINKGIRLKIKNEIWNYPLEQIPQRLSRNNSEWLI